VQRLSALIQRLNSVLLDYSESGVPAQTRFIIGLIFVIPRDDMLPRS